MRQQGKWGEQKMSDSERKRRKVVRRVESNSASISIGSEHERRKRIQAGNELKIDRDYER